MSQLNQEELTEQIKSEYEESKVLLELLKKDLDKSLSGNASAGVRLRKGLRSLSASFKSLAKNSLELKKSQDSVKVS